MSSIGEFAVKLHNWRNGIARYKSSLQKNPQALRAGVIGAAGINWAAFFDPIDTHPDIVLTAIASQSITKAQAQIAKYNLRTAKAYKSYAELLANPDIDLVYIALPNSLHATWAIKAMEAGKHVLVEKPVASTAADVKEIKNSASRTGKVVMEAVHWQFHPAAHAAKNEIDSGKYGKMLSFKATMTIPRGGVAPGDIRLQYDLAGGAMMDFCYLSSSAEYFCGAEQKVVPEVQKVYSRNNDADSRIDEAMDTDMIWKSPDASYAIKCSLHADLSQPKLFGLIPKYWEAQPSVIIELEKAQIAFHNFVAPHLNHSITITMKDGRGKLKSDKKVLRCYQGGPKWGNRGEVWWTTYRYQLEAFVDGVRASQRGASQFTSSPASHWVSLDTSARVMSVIDAVYDKAEMPRRVSKWL